MILWWLRHHADVPPAPGMIREVAIRHFASVFDQLLVVEPPGLPDVGFSVSDFQNAGRSEVGAMW